jgi:hypothetical protein
VTVVEFYVVIDTDAAGDSGAVRHAGYRVRAGNRRESQRQAEDEQFENAAVDTEIREHEIGRPATQRYGSLRPVIVQLGVGGALNVPT